MPNHHDLTEISEPDPIEEPSSSCPFAWCTEQHDDDWYTGADDAPYRDHCVGIEPDELPSDLTHLTCYLRVTETRGLNGVTFTGAEINDGNAESVPLEQYISGLLEMLARAVAWREIAADVDAFRRTLAGVHPADSGVEV